MKNYRLTVHITDAEKKRVETGKFIEGKNKKRTPETKEKIYNTISSYHKSIDACMKELSDIRMKYNIAIGKDFEKKDKLGQELYNISFVN